MFSLGHFYVIFQRAVSIMSILILGLLILKFGYFDSLVLQDFSQTTGTNIFLRLFPIIFALLFSYVQFFPLNFSFPSCMPDMGWSGNKNAGYLHSWSNNEIITRMADSGFRVAGNEWENFDVSRHFDLPAVFATSFRKPLDRALSQFRFECIEDRGCMIKDVHKWWDKRTDLWNVYTRTFADPTVGVKQYFRGSFSQERRNLIATAMDTLSKFHLVLNMEWLAYAAPMVQTVLGFEDVSALTTRVRPHISQAVRNDGQEKNNLGSASIAKASWDPKEYLDEKQYKRMSEDLALDEILTDVARRLFLERLVCDDTEGVR